MPSQQHILAVPYWHGVAQYKTALGKACLLNKGKQTTRATRSPDRLVSGGETRQAG